MSSNEYFVAYGVSKCGKLGHSLRNKSGHCIQCRPASIAYERRFREPKAVYIAESKKAHLVKIGVSDDVSRRVAQLNSINYGGGSDWSLIYQVQCEKSARVEYEVHKVLAKHIVSHRYRDGSNLVTSKEAFSCSVDDARIALSQAVADNEIIELCAGQEIKPTTIAIYDDALIVAANNLQGAVIITMQQYEGGPWWSRGYLAKDFARQLLRLNLFASTIHDSATLISSALSHASTIADSLIDSETPYLVDAISTSNSDSVEQVRNEVLAAGLPVIATIT